MSAHQKAFRFSLLTLFHFYCASGQKAIALAEKKLLDKLRKHRFKLQDNVVPMYAMRGRLGLTVYPTGDAYPCHTGPGEPSQRFNCNRLNKAKPEKSDLATFWQHSKFDHATFPSHLSHYFGGMPRRTYDKKYANLPSWRIILIRGLRACSNR